MKRIAIFASGAGTNLENLLAKIRDGEIKCTAALVFCDKPGAPCLARARKFDVPVVSFSPKSFMDKHAFESRLIETVEQYEIDFIVLAGYMRILTPRFIKRFPWRVINVHPSLLPAFKGAYGIREAFDAKVEKTGVTIHFVTEEVDGGPLILQEEVPVHLDDTLETLEARVHEAEYRLYPRALKLVLEGKVVIENNQIKFIEQNKEAP
ncbi:MAG: phosphoribosylglycinamide formyltransferase [Candidatus Omnitrophica bacterium]|nr:phosphoribosylglycinamide formyltransferase [Candidatus Omnitrophota bacterium]